VFRLCDAIHSPGGRVAFAIVVVKDLGMSQRVPPIVVIGASAGGVRALLDLVAELPADLPAAVLVVLHVGAGRSSLPQILVRAGLLEAAHAQDGDAILAGRILVAPPDHHLLVRDDHVELSHGPRENHSRPAIDPLFRSAARAHGPRVTGVILSGALSDGTTGLLGVKSHGGVTIVQDPTEALVTGMPESAVRRVEPDYILPAREIGRYIATVHAAPVQTREVSIMDPVSSADARIRADFEEQEQDRRNGEITMFTCPDCGGTLWQVNAGNQLHYQCHVGHAWGAEALLGHKSEELEAALWSSVRLFEERASLSRQVTARLRGSGDDAGRIERITEQADLDERRADVIRDVLNTSLHRAVSELSDAVEET